MLRRRARAPGEGGGRRPWRPRRLSPRRSRDSPWRRAIAAPGRAAERLEARCWLLAVVDHRAGAVHDPERERDDVERVEAERPTDPGRQRGFRSEPDGSARIEPEPPDQNGGGPLEDLLVSHGRLGSTLVGLCSERAPDIEEVEPLGRPLAHDALEGGHPGAKGVLLAAPGDGEWFEDGDRIPAVGG